MVKHTPPTIVPTPESPPLQPQETSLSLGALFLKTTLLSLVFAGLMLLLTFLVIGVWGYTRFQQFVRALDAPQETLLAELKSGWGTEPTQSEGHHIILLLGTDALAERGAAPPLTDTLLLLSVDLEQGVFRTLSLPRDLWSTEYQTKINALYVYGHDRYPETPEQFPTEVLSDLIGLPIHHTIVLSLEQLERLIDQVGGIEVTVKEGFTDPLFPRTGVDVTTERDPAILYETIVFEPGAQHFSGQRALQYIRSRHSEDDQGHDLARGYRQQQVIQALFATLSDYRQLVGNPAQTAELYNFYNSHFSRFLPISELTSLAKTLLPHRKTLHFDNHQLATVSDDPTRGVLVNPPTSRVTQNQWVYQISDLTRFQEITRAALLGE